MATVEPRTGQTRTGRRVVIRCAEEADAARLVEMMRAVVAEGSYTVAEPDEWTTTPEQERKTIAAHVARRGYLYLVAEVDGSVVGKLDFQNGYRHRTARSGMFSIYLSREWRGQGVGPLLIQRLLDWATHHPTLEKITLAVFSTNHRAIAAYRKCGFQEEGCCPRDMKLASGEYMDSVLMYRFVKPAGA